jgi:hypothetical protein
MNICRSQWPRGLGRRSTATRLLRLWVRIPPETWTFVCCECCMLSGTGLCDELITRPEESYRLWCVVVCDLETSWMRRLWPTGGCRAKKKLYWLLLYMVMLLVMLMVWQFLQERPMSKDWLCPSWYKIPSSPFILRLSGLQQCADPYQQFRRNHLQPEQDHSSMLSHVGNDPPDCSTK